MDYWVQQCPVHELMIALEQQWSSEEQLDLRYPSEVATLPKGPSVADHKPLNGQRSTWLIETESATTHGLIPISSKAWSS